ncbi:MAG: hypothetical protein U0990_12770 [Candidatus Nanopelagicales bacterium]|nr:hypothetical protein [Candidatus Nanopelagicales bacterium]
MSWRLSDLERRAERRLALQALSEVLACAAFVGIIVVVLVLVAVAK